MRRRPQQRQRRRAQEHRLQKQRRERRSTCSRSAHHRRPRPPGRRPRSSRGRWRICSRTGTEERRALRQQSRLLRRAPQAGGSVPPGISSGEMEKGKEYFFTPCHISSRPKRPLKESPKSSSNLREEQEDEASDGRKVPETNRISTSFKDRFKLKDIPIKNDDVSSLLPADFKAPK